jgi:predicted nucleic acid-binding protein
MIHFLDSSVVVKRYVDEGGSDLVSTFLRGRKTLVVSRLVEVEVPLAFARRARRGDFPIEEARAHTEELLDDLQSFKVAEVRPRTLALARELGWKHGLRAYDAVHLATAVQVRNEMGVALTFWGADVALNRAAQAEGLRVGEVPR